MKPIIGCLHAHYSNIGYIEQALSASEVELIHYVDPGLLSLFGSDSSFTVQDAESKVIQQLEWIAKGSVDAILITCTNYVALLREERLSFNLPIIKIDEPFFGELCRNEKPQILLFTNPATVEGTMARLRNYAESIGQRLEMEARVIPHTFELIMQGKKERYMEVLTEYIRETIQAEGGNRRLSVAQLSMVDAARKAGQESGGTFSIGDPLEPLAAYVEKKLAELK
ncbi:hypothetical protein D7Z26_17830 [Cohnella endophytica]|uniref:Asp/Glu/hydantoin racemase n=1 Tax=Cohnella endophytica TaxID=2419778 RepID=A0A494XLR2_9BACL|nr:hypothetical protein [Cohnella endophytica]RKP51635.1 hypothetical protein D7Z26_17830 [Cohnella endophytica]